MPQSEISKQRKQTLIDLVNRIKIRSDVSYNYILDVMSIRLDDIYTEGKFSKFRARPDIESDYELKEMLALVHAFVDNISIDNRCTARDAIQLFDLTGMQLKDFALLKDIFPEAEFDKAWEMYQQEQKLAPNKDNSGDFFVPLYPQLFIGREDNVKAVYDKLGLNAHQKRVPFTIVRGYPGVGKTTFINRIVHDPKIKAAFPDGILWTSLGFQGSVLTAMKKWARQLNAFHIEQVNELNEVVTLLRNVLSARKVLLVVDDIWNETDGLHFKALATAHTTFLMTTRLTEVANKLAGVPEEIYVLPTLSQEKSLELLGYIAPQTSRQYKTEFAALADTLEGLPLALRVAGSLIEQEHGLGFDVHQLIDELQDKHSKRLMSGQAGTIDEATGTNPTIALLFERSVSTLSPEAQAAFAYLGAFASKPATFDIPAMKAVWDVEDPVPIVRMLVGRGLLEPMGSQRFQMHYTLTMYAQSMLDEGSEGTR